MKKSRNLFELIQSLSKSEKRYLRLFATLHGSNKAYLKLFDALQNTSEYDEAAFLQQHAQQSFTQNYAFAKSYLYRFILKALESFHANAAVKSEITGLLQKADLLFDKALYHQCVKQLSKARKLAYQYDSHRLLLEVLNWELRIVLSPNFTGELKRNVAQILEEERLVLQELQVINRARRLRFGIKSLLEQPQDSESQAAESIAAAAAGLDALSGTADSLLARSELLRARAFYHYYHCNWQAAYAQVQTEMHNMENCDAILLDRTWLSKYIMANGMAAECAILAADYTAAETILQRLQQLSQAIPNTNRTTAHLSFRAQEQYFLQLLNLQIHAASYAAAARSVATIQSSEFYNKVRDNHMLQAQLNLKFALVALLNNSNNQSLDALAAVFGEARLPKAGGLRLAAYFVAFMLHVKNDGLEAAAQMLQVLRSAAAADTSLKDIVRFGTQLLRSRECHTKAASPADLADAAQACLLQAPPPALRSVLNIFGFGDWLRLVGNAAH